jgi:transposase
MTRKKNIYSPEFRTQAISLVREAKQPATAVARDLGVNVNTLYNWLGALPKNSTAKAIKSDSLDEIKRLRKALAQAEMERDILKKAAAYFAKETL